MKIGLIGYGKMGRDIFALFFDKLPDAEFAVLDIYGAEENTAAVMKTLDKNLRRKKLTQEQYDKKKASFCFTDEISDLKDCDIVIEAIFEDIRAKKTTFHQLAQVVSEKCLLLTNTSSLSIPEIFSDIPHKERCFGLHFFYPVKLTGFVELNVLPETSDESAEIAKQLVIAGGKKPIVFTGSYHIYLNQIISCVVAHAIYLRSFLKVSANELNSALSELFPVAAPFDVVDSVGLGLMSGKPDNFRIERNKELLEYSSTKMNNWVKEGCPKETHTFLEFMASKDCDTGKDCSGAVISMAALILNEIINARTDDPVNDNDTFTEAVQDTLGLAESPAFYYKKYGTDTLFEALNEFYEKTNFASYAHKDASVWEKYYA